ncbi:DoxX family protein [Luteolibacter pohnpeiensis]|uniref:DoxX family protein n=1 Tax=Luteolibacter pohnpeiensis TaxID=454153 RepID=A0A934S9M9_9BACT|nr:DoxX family protein [Luteolibacter pohnpeiensis]MBK1883799.1 DoxX family protein [Luteolibacter pohnpeiensis]
MKRLLFDCGTRDTLASFGLLVLRVSGGLMMLLGHGMGKYHQFDKLKDNWHVPHFLPFKFMSPPISLMATIGAEVGAAALIVIGLATRPAAFVLGFAMVVAAFEVLHDAPLFLGATSPAAKEPALLYLLIAVVIILAGPGKYSLDAAIYQDKKRRRW